MMISDADKLKAICEERRALESGIADMQRSAHQAVFAFVTIALGLFTFLKEPAVIASPSLRSILVFAASQLLFFLALFIVSLFAAQSVANGYIIALEQRINALCGETITFWETSVTRRFLVAPPATLFWCTILLALFALVVFLSCVFLAVRAAIVPHFGIIAACEILILLLLGVRAAREPELVASFACAQIGAQVPPRSPKASPADDISLGPE